MINRIQIIIEGSSPYGDGMDALALMVAALGINPETDVDVAVVPDAHGEPTLVSVISKRGNNNNE